MSISEIGGLAMMLKPRTLLSVSVLSLSSPVLAQSVAAPYTSGTRYDIAGRVTGTISPSASGTQGPFLATRNSYDAIGNLSTVEEGQLASWQGDSIAPANWASFTPARTTSYSYDSYGRKTKEQLYAGAVAAGQMLGVTQYSYDLYGRVVCTAVRMDPSQWSGQPDPCVPQTNGPNGADRITRTSYDYLGDVTVVQRAVGTPLQQNYETFTWSLSNGGAGRPATIADANGNLTSYTYSVTGLNLLTQANFPSPTTVGQSSSTDYEAYGYDANGNRTSLRKRDGVTINYLYDALNRVTQKNVPASASGAAGYSVFYGYDLGGHQLYARFGSAAGLGITNSYDGFGQRTSETNNMDGTNRTFGSAYDANGNRIQMNGDQGFNEGFNYDGLDRMTGVRELSPTGPQIAWFTYDQLGRRNGLSQGYSTPVSATSYAYDGASRLQTQTHDFVTSVAGTDQVLGFNYNPASQIVQRTRTNSNWEFTEQVPGLKSYVTNGLNQYLAAGLNSFGYDANGNLRSDGINSYVYDAENRLVSMTGAKSVSLVYDPLGRLWQYSGPDSGTLRFLHDGDHLAMEESTAGAKVRVYAYGPGVDEPLVWYEFPGGVQAYFLHADHQGSIVGVTGLNGNTVAIDKYDEWGVPAAGNIGRFQYTGQAWLPDLGLYYYKARMYSSRLGRFLQTDPIGYKDQVNLYAYVGSDPVNGRDPSGTSCQSLGDGRSQHYKCTIDFVREGKNLVPFAKAHLTPGQRAAAIRFNNSYTAAVNRMNTLNKTVPVAAMKGVPGSGGTVTGHGIASALAAREMIYEKGATYRNSEMTTYGNPFAAAAGLGPVVTHIYEPEMGSTTQSRDIGHEGIHSSPEMARQNPYDQSMGATPYDQLHQQPYNDAADELLGGGK